MYERLLEKISDMEKQAFQVVSHDELQYRVNAQ